MSRPQIGDTLVTLRCQDDMRLEDRIELLAYAFAKVVQGAVLRRVVQWDITNGCIKFIIGHIIMNHAPRGMVEMKLEDAPSIRVETEQLQGV